MKAETKRTVTVEVTLKMDDREAKLLGAIIGALSPSDAKEAIERSISYNSWVKGGTDTREVTDFTGDLYETLYVAIEGVGAAEF